MINKFGKFITFVVPMIPVPFTRSGMVLATRLLDVKGAMRLILGAIAIRVTAEVYLYYAYGTSLFPFLISPTVLSSPHPRPLLLTGCPWGRQESE